MTSYLDSTLQRIDDIQTKISTAESHLSQIILDAKRELAVLYDEKRSLEEEADRARGEIAPIRRVPAEILREIFLVVFEDDAKGQAGWTFSAVSQRWRALALETPRLWTRIRLATKLDATNGADVIRLWLERSGPSMPLDIEIFLRVPQAKASIPAECASGFPWPPPAVRRSRRRGGPPIEDTGYIPPVGSGSESWGHVAVFYLKQQMPRWKRFVFRFERIFASLSAFKGMFGRAHQLEELDFSSIEPLDHLGSWLPDAGGISSPALQKVALINTPVSLDASMLSQPLQDIHLSSSRPIAIVALFAMLAKNSSTLRCLSLNFSSLLPPVVPMGNLPYSSTSPLCMPLLEELSVGGHTLLAHLLNGVALPSLEELNVDIDLGRGGVAFNLGVAAGAGFGQGSCVEELVQDLLARGSPAPADKLKALSISYGFGNGRRLVKEREREALPFIQALDTAHACTCSGTTFLPSGHPSTPPTPNPSVVHDSWRFLGNLPALESLKVGLGGAPGPAWTTNGNTNIQMATYHGGAADVDLFLGALCVPDEDFMTGAASIQPPAVGGVNHHGPGVVVQYLGNVLPPQNNMNPTNIANPPLPPPPPPMNVVNMGLAGAAGFGAGANGNTWFLPTLLELGIKVGSALFLPSQHQRGSFHPHDNFYSASHSNFYSSAYDSGWPADREYVRKLLDLVEARNPKAGSAVSVGGIVPARLERVEVVLDVAGVPAKGDGHAAGQAKNGNRNEGDKGKGKAKEVESALAINIKELLDSASAPPTSDSSSSPSSSPISTSSKSKADPDAKAAKRDLSHNSATARSLLSSEAVSWIESRVPKVDFRCKCVFGEVDNASWM